MSLNWSITDVKNYEDFCYETKKVADLPAGTNLNDLLNGGWGYLKDDSSMIIRVNPITERLIWSTLFVDLPGISETNASDFFTRLSLHEKLIGTSLYRTVDGTQLPRWITREDVDAHIGLRTNVSPQSFSTWAQRLLSQYRSDIVGSEVQGSPLQKLERTIDDLDSVIEHLENTGGYGKNLVERVQWAKNEIEAVTGELLDIAEEEECWKRRYM